MLLPRHYCVNTNAQAHTHTLTLTRLARGRVSRGLANRDNRQITGAFLWMKVNCSLWWEGGFLQKTTANWLGCHMEFVKNCGWSSLQPKKVTSVLLRKPNIWFNWQMAFQMRHLWLILNLQGQKKTHSWALKSYWIHLSACRLSVQTIDLFSCKLCIEILYVNIKKKILRIRTAISKQPYL